MYARAFSALKIVPKADLQAYTLTTSYAGFALYRALLRLVPRIALPDDLTSRPGWIHPIRYLIRSGFRRNKNDTSPRLVTSALKSGYRFLSLLTRAQDASSTQHAEVLSFLRQRQASFPPPPPAPAPAESEPERPRPPPLLTKVSAPGEPPVYRSTARPVPLEQLSGGVRKVPVLDETSNMGFLRIGKPQSHWHANFLRRKAERRQARITALQELWEDGRRAAAAEDAWEAALAQLARRERVDGGDFADEAEIDAAARDRKGMGPHERVIKEFGVDHLGERLSEEAADVIARTTAMLDIVEAEKRLAEQEKKEKKERRRKAWEERQRVHKQGGEQEQQRGDAVAPGPSGSQDLDTVRALDDTGARGDPEDVKPPKE